MHLEKGSERRVQGKEFFGDRYSVFGVQLGKCGFGCAGKDFLVPLGGFICCDFWRGWSDDVLPGVLVGCDVALYLLRMDKFLDLLHGKVG